MPATVRDILLVIRAKEDATRALGSVSSSMRRASAAADAASARARAAALRAQAQQARIMGATPATIRNLENQAKAWDKQAEAVGRNSAKFQELGQSLQGAGQLLTVAGIGIAAVGGTATVSLLRATSAAQEWDRQVRLTWTQVDKKYNPTLKQLGDIGIRTANKVAVPFDQMQTALFDIFSSMDVNLKDAESLLTSFSKAAVAGQVSVQDASRATIGLMNTFDVPFKDVNKVLNTQFELVKEGIGDYSEWVKLLGNVSPSARRAGQSMDTMAAALATATRQGMTAARASTSVARAFDAMSNPKTEKNLHQLGIETRKANGQFRPMVDVLADWKKQLDKLPEKDKVKEILDVLKGAGGTIEARRFLQNILQTKNGLKLFQTELQAFAKDKDAFKRGYNEMSNSVEAKSILLKNAWKTLVVTVGHALIPSLLSIIKVGQKVLDWFNKLPAPVKDMIAKAALLASVLLTVGGVLTVIVGGFVAVAGAIAAAGTAILPVIAGMAIIGGLFVGAAAGIGAFVTAIVLAYQKSDNFRKLVKTLWDDIKGVAGVFIDTGKQIWDAIDKYVLPALGNLWRYVSTNIIPIFQNYADTFRTKVLPVVRAFGDWTAQRLVPAIKRLGDIINNDVIPALDTLKRVYQANKPEIDRVAKAMLILIGIAGTQLVAALVGAVIWLGNLVKWFAYGAAGTAILASAINGLINGAIAGWISALKTVIGWIKELIKWFATLVPGASAVLNKLPGLFGNSMQKVKGAAGSVSLYGVGQNIAQGLANGILGKMGAVRAAASSLANVVQSIPKIALGIHSPSTVFRDIGANIVRGLTLGVSSGGTQKGLKTALFNLSRSVMNSIDDAKISKHLSKKQKKAMERKWSGRLSTTTAKLNKLESQRVALQTRLAAAQKSVNDQIKVRNDLAQKITDALSNQTDLTTLDSKSLKSGQAMAAGLQTRLKALQTFQANLTNLTKRGFDKQTIADLASQGVDSAGAITQTLVNANDQDLKNISNTQAAIRKIASSMGTTVAGNLYNAGIAAAQGLAKGLQSQINKITKSMTAIANALVKQIKKELGIHSPSRVMHAIGVNTAKGYINGYTDHMNKQMSRLTPDVWAMNRYGRSSGSYAGANYSKTYHQNITVNTQEIDPRKTSAQLGWELMGKVG